MSNPETLFSSPTDQEIYVASVNGGLAARVGPNPRTLPLELHLPARQAGCNAGAAPAISKEVMDAARAPKIEAALKDMLLRQQVGDFTQAGYPNLSVLGQIIGEPAPRDQVYEIFDRMKAEAEAAAKAEEKK